MRASWLLFFLGACTNPQPVPDSGEGLLGHRLLDVFPNPMLIRDGLLNIDPQSVVVPIGGTTLPVERFSGWRTGFSSGQTTLFELADVDPAALPSWRQPTPGQGGVLLVDLTSGEFLPVMAELDAHPGVTDTPTLLVRPLVALTPGHRIAVVVTTLAAPRPERIDALLSGTPPTSLAPWADHFAALVEQLAALGVDEQDIAVVTDFPIDDGRQPLAQVLDEAVAASAWEFTYVRDEPSTLVPRTFRAATGRFTAPTYVGDDAFLNLDPATGVVSATGSAEYSLYVHIPESVADAPQGTVPVVLFGHGIFGTPEAYLNDADDPNGLVALLDQMGAIGIATRWEGLSADERIDAIGAAIDFGRLPLVPDRLVQSNAAIRSLQMLLTSGALYDDPVFDGMSGQSLPSDSLSYYGISLGGIEGAVQVASGAPVSAAVLHVGGGTWSTMLERSTQWPTFELVLNERIPLAADRQQLYAISQLFWDPVDPIAWVHDWSSDTPTLWQESLGDEQVPNMTTRTLVRSVGAGVVGPLTEPVWGTQTLDTPSAPGTTAMSQLDPQRGLPEDINRPPSPSGAHSVPRTWASTALQTATFLDPARPGTVIHPCGDAPCSADNPQPEAP